jgi:hypothetical protein
MKVLREDLGNYADLTTLPLDADVVGELRELNTRRGADTACMWQLALDFEDDETWGRGPASWLDAGTAGTSGALEWIDRDGTFIPLVGWGCCLGRMNGCPISTGRVRRVVCMSRFGCRLSRCSLRWPSWWLLVGGRGVWSG